MSSTATLVRFTGSTPKAASDEVAVADVRVFGTRAWIAHRRDEGEWRRRRRHGLAEVLAWDLLDVLMELPAGMPVPVASLDAADRRLLYRAPTGVVTFSGRMVTRRLVPAVTPLLAVVIARRWSDGLDAAGRFAAYCRRMMVVSQIPADEDEALMTAAMYGIGVAGGGACPSQVLLEPEPLADWQPTTAWWRFCEQVYGQAAIAAD